MGKAHLRTTSGTAGRRAAWPRDPSAWLALAAAPTFAAMALWTGLFEGDRADMLCMGPADASPLSGMVVMYLLMAAFHSSPWLRLMSGRPGSVGGS